MEKVLVLYHYPCTDGIFSALAAFMVLGYENVTYKAHSTTGGQNQLDQIVALIEQTKFDRIYLLDYAGRPGFLSKLRSTVGNECSIRLIDHHKTGVKLYSDYFNAMGTKRDGFYFDMQFSGCVLALTYFKPESITNEMRWLFAYVQDNDLWHHSLEDSRAFTAGFQNLRLEMDFERNPQIFNQLLSLRTEDLIETGKPCVEARDKQIAEILPNKFPLRLVEGIICYAVMIEDPTLISETGHRLADESMANGWPPVGAVCINLETEVKVSLRSTNDFDTTLISTQYRGGGHEGASGFTVSHYKFEEMKNMK